MFLDPQFGSELDQRSPAPTALHSWGCPLRACPCGCRKAGFSLERLRSGGLRGVGVRSLAFGGLRHLHPQEAGLLNGVPPSFQYVEDCRAALCMIGQIRIASPLQSLCVLAHVAQWAQQEFQGQVTLDPHDLLTAFKRPAPSAAVLRLLDSAGDESCRHCLCAISGHHCCPCHLWTD